MLRSVSFWLWWGLFFTMTTLLHAQDEYRYSYMPKKVYENQVFPVTLINTSERNDHPQFQFDISSTTKPLFKRPLTVRNGNDIFYTFYFKAGKVDIRIPRLFIISDNVDISLDPQMIPLASLKRSKAFCNVLAADMKIKNYQVSNYDTKNHMVTLSIEAYEANLEDISLQGVEENGIEEIKRDNAKVTAEFYVILPRTQKELSFNYFNTIKKRFITLNIPIELPNASVTTQSDLNPKVDAFERLKRYTLIFFALFFMFMFLWKRDFFYLILGVVSLITLMTFYIPHKKVCVKQGAPLYILPTQTSTIGTRVENKIETMLLGERGEFKKVEYKKGMIGWIKNEDLCKN
jgi:hypothetical protein